MRYGLLALLCLATVGCDASISDSTSYKSDCNGYGDCAADSNVTGTSESTAEDCLAKSDACSADSMRRGPSTGGYSTSPSGEVIAVPSGEAIPVGDLPGWRQVLTEDFNLDASVTTFDSTYNQTWCGYVEGTGDKYYKLVSAHDGMMDVNLDGSRGAAGVFGGPEDWGAMLYGRFSIRFKVADASGYGAALMLWPSSNTWGEGEIDFPEGDFDGSIHVFHHPIDCTDCSSSDGLDTESSWRTWHTATTEWTPDSVEYYLDEELIKTVTHDIPTTYHRMTIQMAPTGSGQAGHFLVDWVAIWDKWSE